MKAFGKFLIAAAALAVASPVFAAELPARIKAAGKIVIGTNPNYAPITYKDPKTNTLTGFDIEFGEALAAELGVKVEWQEIAFAQMLPSLQTGRIDTVLAFMADNPTRRETADFVDYMKSGAQFYIVKSMADKIKTLEDLCGKKVGASRTTAWPKQIGEWSDKNCVAKGKPAMEVIGTEGSVDARTQLKTERLDGAVQGNETIKYEQTLDPGVYVLIGEPFTGVLAGIPFLKAETQLRDAVQAAAASLMKKGTYQAIAKKYNLEQNVVSTFEINKGN
jgi:polar amino acid transport system substrate-binding protein